MFNKKIIKSFCKGRTTIRMSAGLQPQSWKAASQRRTWEFWWIPGCMWDINAFCQCNKKINTVLDCNGYWQQDPSPWQNIREATSAAVCSSGLSQSHKKMWIYWWESSTGSERCLKVRNIFYMRIGWKSWDCSVLRREALVWSGIDLYEILRRGERRRLSQTRQWYPVNEKGAMDRKCNTKMITSTQEKFFAVRMIKYW